MLPNNVLAHKTWSLYVDTMCGSMRFRCYALANGSAEKFCTCTYGYIHTEVGGALHTSADAWDEHKLGFSPF